MKSTGDQGEKAHWWTVHAGCRARTRVDANGGVRRARLRRGNGAAPRGAECTPVTSALARAPRGAVRGQDPPAVLYICPVRSNRMDAGVGIGATRHTINYQASTRVPQSADRPHVFVLDDLDLHRRSSGCFDSRHLGIHGVGRSVADGRHVRGDRRRHDCVHSGQWALCRCRQVGRLRPRTP